MSNAVIRAELETRLKTWADAQSPQVPIAFQNVSFTKPAGPYLEAYLIPNATLNKELSGSRKTYIGLFQINCWAPKGTGMGQVEALAQSIVDDVFPFLGPDGAVSIEQTPSADPPLWDAGWVIVPVTVKYRMETF